MVAFTQVRFVTGTIKQTPEEGSLTADEYGKKLDHWAEVAQMLRTNIVQAKAIEAKGQDTYGGCPSLPYLWHPPDTNGTPPELRITPFTELGDNSTISKPKPLPTTPFPNRGKRRKESGSGSGCSA